MFTLRSLQGPSPVSPTQLATPLSKTGDLVDVLLMYFAFRAYVHDLEDVRWLLQRRVIFLILVVICLVIEPMTFSNPLKVLGAMPSVWIDDDDAVRIRCWGAFSHPALLGTIGAWLAVLYVSMLMSAKYRVTVVAGLALCTVVLGLADAGGLLSGLALGMVGWGCWRFGEYMRAVRVCVVLMFVVPATVMRDSI